jgi:thioredoxin reductase (NADPH)
MQERAFANERIEFCWNSVVVDILGEHAVEAVQLRDVHTGEERVLAVTGVFVAIGHRPNTDLVKGQLNLDDNGYIITRPNRTATNLGGVFACGDVQDHFYRQAITAAGSGCAAAIEAERWLEEVGR